MLIPSRESIANCSKVLSIETAPRGIRLTDAIIDITFSAIWSGIARSHSSGGTKQGAYRTHAPLRSACRWLSAPTSVATPNSFKFIFDSYCAPGAILTGVREGGGWLLRL